MVYRSSDRGRFGLMRRFVPALVMAAAPAYAQTPTPSKPAQPLVVRTLDGREHRVAAQELSRFARIDTTVNSHHVVGRYSGVSLVDLFGIAGVPRGDSLRGKSLAVYFVVQGADGYRVVLSPAEFDPAFSDRVAILADARDGSPLPADEGPYHLIIPDEKRPARWVRQVVRIEARRAP
jgi:hypothetical protein